MEPSMSPGHCVMISDDTLVIPRLAPHQIFDANTQKVYHQALIAIHQMSGSHNNYYVQELGQGCTHYVNLKGQKVGVYAHGNLLYDLLADEQRASLGDFWKVLRVVLLQQETKPNGLGMEAKPNGLQWNIFRTIRIRSIRPKDLKTNSWLYHQAMSLLERNLLRKRAGPHFVLTG